MLKKIGLVFLGLILAVTPVLAHLTVDLPVGVIEYTGGSFDKTGAAGVLQDVVPGNAGTWFNPNVTSLSQIIGYAHIGQLGITQTQANARIALIQIWGWKDTDGDGVATINDSRVGTRTTKWILLSQLHPSASAGDGSGGNVIGYNTNDPVGTSAYADILQVGSGKGTAIPLAKGQSWLLLIRVIDIVGNSNLMLTPGGVEQWDDGDTSNGIGSDVPASKYLTADGKTPGTSTQRVANTAVVWIYVPKT